jgi:F0F1-type ATP synthase membrane subunit a
MLLLVVITLMIRIFSSKNKNGVVAYCSKSVCKFIKESIIESLGIFDFNVFSFIFGLFLVTLSCNYIGIIPIFGEPTVDINTTMALGTCSFVYVQYQGIKAKGLSYFKKYFSPIFIMLPINIIQQLAKIASLSFRLFGNMLGDNIIWELLMGFLQFAWFIYIPITIASISFLFFYHRFYLVNQKKYSKLASIAFWLISWLAVLQCFFGLFQGFIQAYVIALLTNTYIANERAEGDGH